MIYTAIWKKRETDEENPLFPRIFQTFNLY